MWPALRDWWILADPERTAEVATLLATSGIGADARTRSTEDAEYLTELRNTVKLRSVVVGWLVRLGTVDDQPAPMPADLGVGPAPSIDATTETMTVDDGWQPLDRAVFDQIREGVLAPSTGLHFDRIDRFADLGWLTFAAQVFDYAQDLAPGDDLMLTHPRDAQEFAGLQRGAMFRRLSAEAMELMLASADMLPSPLRYTERHDQVLVDPGWLKEDGIYRVRGSVPDQVDDLVGLLIQTLREVYLVASPAEMKVDLFTAERVDRPMPDAPAVDEPVVIRTAERAVAVLSAIFTELGARIAPGPDPLTFQIRLDQWLAWVHIDKKQPVAELAIVISDALPNDAGERARLLAQALLDLSTYTLRWSRPVVREQQLLLATSIAMPVTSLGMWSAALNGLVSDANATLLAVGSVLALRADDVEAIGKHLGASAVPNHCHGSALPRRTPRPGSRCGRSSASSWDRYWATWRSASS